MTFPSLYRMVNSIEANPHVWADYAEAMLSSSMESMRRTAGEMLAKQQESEREFGSIMGELYAHLNFLDDPALQASLKDPDASFADTVHADYPVTWFINVPVEYVNLWSPVLRVMFTVQMLYKSRAPSAPPVNMIVDEAGQMGRFEALLKSFTFGRGAGVRSWSLFQDAGQIVRNFGPEALQGFMGSATLRQFFGVRDYETARMISEMLGTETLEFDDQLRQSDARRAKMHAAMRVMNGDDPFSAVSDIKHYSYASGHRSQQARRLMAPDEILTMPEDRQIMFISGKNLKPVYAQKFPYFKLRHMQAGICPILFIRLRIQSWSARALETRRARIVSELAPREFTHPAAI